jgi:hypothetical protein
MMLLKDVLKMFERDQILDFYDMDGKIICDTMVITVERDGATNFGISENTNVHRVEFGIMLLRCLLIMLESSKKVRNIIFRLFRQQKDILTAMLR